jgi:hypothetical protein
VFDTTGILNGQIVARYVVDPSKKFFEVVKEFADSAAYRFSAKNHALQFVPQDSAPAAIVIDGSDKTFTPSRLQLKASEELVVNDAIVLGDIEPQGYMNEYFVGDGFTALYPLLSSVYGVDSSLLLDDDFGGSQIDPDKWTVYDTVNNWLQVSNGYLNALGGNNDGSYGVYIQSANLIPLEGQLRLTHGEFDFISASSGVIASLWSGTPNSSYTGCYFGIECAKSGGNTIIKPIVNGVVDGTQSLTVNYARRYIIRTLVNFNRVNRLTQSFSSLNSSGTVVVYGGVGTADTVDYTTIITEVNPSDGSVTNSYTWSNANAVMGTTDVFATYISLVLNDLHCTVSNITLSTPMQVRLEIKANGTSTWTTKLVGPNDIDAMDGLSPIATVVDSNSGASTKSSFLGSPQYNPGQASLQFFKDTTKQLSYIPQVGDLLHVSYRRAGACMGRVQDKASIASEGTLWSDNGIRSLVKMDFDPKPRTSEECELAAAALITDGGYQQYEGTYLQYANYGVTGEPVSGTILKFRNLPSGMPTVPAEEIHEVVTTMTCGNPLERFEHNITFGKPDRIRQLLAKFARQTDVFAPQDTAEIPNFVELSALGTTSVGDITAPTLDSWTSSNLNFNTNQAAPSGGGFEVRYTDDGWGADDGRNLVLRTSSPTFAVPRTARGRICFVRAYDGRNKVLYSEDFTNAAWVKTSASVVNSTTTNPDGNTSFIGTNTFALNTGTIGQESGVAAASKLAVFSLALKGTVGQQVTIQLRNNAGAVIAASSAVTFTGSWQRASVSFTFAGGAVGNISAYISAVTANTFSLSRASLEVGTLTETVYCKTNSTVYGAFSRYAAGLRVQFPLIPPVVDGVTITYVDVTKPIITVALPANQQDIWTMEGRDSDNSTVLYKKDLVAAGFDINFTKSGNATRSLSFFVYTINLLGEYGTAFHATATIPTPSISGLAVDEDIHSLKWTGANSPLYRVQIDKVDTTYANLSVNTSTVDPLWPLSPLDFFLQRYVKITPYDAIGDGTPATVSHLYTPTAVVEFNNNEVQSVGPPPTPTTDPTVTAPYTNYPADYIGFSWSDYAYNKGR